jgi:hypothetical protein
LRSIEQGEGGTLLKKISLLREIGENGNYLKR